MTTVQSAELESSGTIHKKGETMFKKGVAVILGVILALFITVPTQAKTVEYDEQELLARVVEAEAGNQGIIGKRLVVAVIYNRVESEKFPNTIYEVLTSPHQFSTVWNGQVEKMEITPETLFAIEIERAHRSDNEILYFNCGECSGKFAYRYKGHNFGK